VTKSSGAGCGFLFAFYNEFLIEQGNSSFCANKHQSQRTAGEMAFIIGTPQQNLRHGAWVQTGVS
jgi:hypothetical protein